MTGRRMEPEKQSETDLLRSILDARRYPRYKLETEIRVYPRNSSVVRGHTVDISESGISATLRVEVPVGEVVRLEFSLPTGEVDVYALVRQRSAFRYGFQFVESSSAQDVIGRTCRQLAVEQTIFDPTRR
jgi:PilZ domain